MAEMNRDQNQRQQRSRQNDMGMGGNQDVQSGRGQQPSKPQWDGNERRTGAERRGRSDRSDRMQMNEGSSR